MKNTIIGISVVSLVLLVVLAMAFPDVFFHPNGFLFGEGVDAFKSYFNFSYHLRYGQGLKLDAVNYPFGDHLFYTNSHPLYQLILDPIEKVLPISKYGPAIMNMGMFSSILIGGSFIFLILRKFSLPTWYAVILAILIQGMYPQFARIYGHFEMTLAYAFPVFWYLVILFFENHKKNLITILLILWSTFMGMIGAYLVAINSVFVLALVFVLVISNRRKFRSFLPTAFRLLVIALVPLFSIKGLVSLTDWITDRPTNPWGFYVFHANPVSVFVPYFEPLRQIIERWGVSMSYDAEGRAYMGIAVVFFYFTFPIFFLIRAIRKKTLSAHGFFPFRKLNPHILASLIVLIYSMCIPFKWGLQDITDSFPILKQFRSLGRFAWPFYYVNAVFLASYVYLLYRRQRFSGRRGFAFVLIAGVLSLWAFETGYYIYRLSIKTAIQKNELLAKDDQPYVTNLNKAGFKAQDFQAIFSIPFASTNGDKMLFMDGANNLRYAQSYAYHLHLPLIQSFSPRLSFSGGLTSAQLVAHPNIAKARLNFMNEKPILIVQSGAPANDREEDFLDLAESFYKDERINLSIIYPSALNDAHRLAIEEFKSLKSRTSIDGPTSINNLPFHYNGFNSEDTKPPEIFTGTGAFDRIDGEYYLYDGFLAEEGILGETEVSFWLYIDPDHHDMPIAYVDVYDRNGEKKDVQKIETRAEYNIIGMWVRCAITMDIQPETRYRVRLWQRRITCDDLLIRKVDDEIIVPIESGYLWNNFPIYQSELNNLSQ